MLVQEYIAQVLDTQPPDEWKEDMHKAFTTGCTTEDEEEAAGVDSDDTPGHVGSDSDAEISDEQDDDDDNDDDDGGDSEATSSYQSRKRHFQ